MADTENTPASNETLDQAGMFTATWWPRPLFSLPSQFHELLIS